MRVKLFSNFTCHHLIVHIRIVIFKVVKKSTLVYLPICPESFTEKYAICPEHTLPKMLSK